jgi:hypothetical protein
MHVLERYALGCGAKIGRPHIEEEFYPLIDNNFIVLHSGGQIQSKSYDYYNEVVNIITPYLIENNIKILQIGDGGDHPINGCVHLQGKASVRQIAYIINKSKLVLCSDTFSTHLASGLNKKNITLYGPTYKECHKPYWSDPVNYSMIEPLRKNTKPSFSNQERIKSINSIKPEAVASSVLDHLNIKHNLDKYKTLYIGEYYNYPVIEIVPNFNILNYNISQNALNIRMDYHFDENNLFLCSQNKDICVITDKPISEPCLQAIKPSLQQVIFKADKSTRPSDLATIKKVGTNLKICTYDKKNLNKIRYNLIDWEVDLEEKKSKKDLDESDEVCYTSKYISSKITLSNGKKYASKAALKNDVEMISMEASVIDTDDFWEEIEHFMIFNYA